MQSKFFKIGDLLIYFFLLLVFSFLAYQVLGLQQVKASKAEIYIDGQLKYIFPLQEEEKNIFVDTVLGGVNIELKDYKVRVTTSNSPRKIAVKQGYISSPGEVIIGIPDRLVIKISGETESDIDFIIK